MYVGEEWRPRRRHQQPLVLLTDGLWPAQQRQGRGRISLDRSQGNAVYVVVKRGFGKSSVGGNSENIRGGALRPRRASRGGGRDCATGQAREGGCKEAAKNKRNSPVRDELQRGPEVLVVVGNPLHQRLPVGHLQLDASLRVMEMGFVVLLLLQQQSKTTNEQRDGNPCAALSGGS